MNISSFIGSSPGPTFLSCGRADGRRAVRVEACGALKRGVQPRQDATEAAIAASRIIINDVKE